MPNGMRKIFAAFAYSAFLAASGPVATPASAQAGGGGGYGGCQYDPLSGNWYVANIITHFEPCDPNSYGNCQYDPLTGNWYRADIITHLEPCNPNSQAADEPGDRPSAERTESSGQ
jgi:hypothetical protein